MKSIKKVFNEAFNRRLLALMMALALLLTCVPVTNAAQTTNVTAINLMMPDGIKYSDPESTEYLSAENSSGFEEVYGYKVTSIDGGVQLTPADGRSFNDIFPGGFGPVFKCVVEYNEDKNAEITFGIKEEENVVGDVLKFVPQSMTLSLSLYKAKSTTLTVIPEVKASHTVTLDSTEGDFILTASGNSTATVAYDGSLIFNATAKAGITGKPHFTIDGDDAGERIKAVDETANGGTYQISNVTKNITISATGETQKVKVTFNNPSKGVTDIKNNDTKESILKNGAEVEYGKTLKFTVEPDEGYDVVSVSTSAEVLQASEEGVYTLENVTQATLITVMTERKTFTVTPPTNEAGQEEWHFSYNGTNTVAYGSTVSFQIMVAEGYKAPDVKVTMGKDQLMPGAESKLKVSSNASGLTYTINNVDGNITIEVTSNGKKSYTVTLPSVEDTRDLGYTVEKTSLSTTVEHNDSFGFKVTVDPHYDATNMVVSANGKPFVKVQPAENVYTYKIDSVTEDQSITVTGVTPKNYSISAESSGEGWTYNGTATSVTYNSPYNFTVSPTTGYGEPTVTVKMDGSDDLTVEKKTLTKDGNKYTIPHVTGNVTIQVTTGEKHTYAVTLNANYAGVTEIKSREPDEKKEVKHGETFHFSVKVDTAHYNVSEGGPTVTGNGYPATLDEPNDESGVYNYKIENVTSALNITVTAGITPKEFTVTVPNSTEQKDGGYSISYGNRTVAYKGNFEFTLTVDELYDVKDQISVTASNGCAVEATPEDDNNRVYHCKVTVTDNTKISVSGLEVKQVKVTKPTPDGNSPAANFTIDGLDTVKANETYTFTVKANAGYKVKSVSVNDQIITTVSGNYSIKASDYLNGMTIAVETEANVYTVRVNDVLNGGQTTHTYSFDPQRGTKSDDVAELSEGKIVFKTLSGPYYTFNGWTQTDGEGAPTDCELGNDGKNWNVTANWSVDWEKAVTKNAVTISGDKPDQGKFTVHFRLDTNIVDETLMENAKVARAGIFFAGYDIESTDGSYEETFKSAINNLGDPSNSYDGHAKTIKGTLGDNKAYAAVYGDVNCSLAKMEVFKFSVAGAPANGTFTAVGFVQIRDNDKDYYIVFSDCASFNAETELATQSVKVDPVPQSMDAKLEDAVKELPVQPTEERLPGTNGADDTAASTQTPDTLNA